jgi:hypothetical protein
MKRENDESKPTLIIEVVNRERRRDDSAADENVAGETWAPLTGFVSVSAKQRRSVD